MMKSASAYHSHGNLLRGLSFMTAILDLRLRVNFVARLLDLSLWSLLDDALLLGPVPKRGELSRLFLMLKMRLAIL